MQVIVRRLLTGIALAAGLALCACAADVGRGIPHGEEGGEVAAYEAYLTGRLALAELVSPGLGLWVIHRPGAVDALTRVDSADELAATFPWLHEELASPACSLGEGMPEADCRREGLLPAGRCWLSDAGADFERASAVLEQLVVYELTDGAALGEVKRLERHVERKALVGGSDTVLYFGRVEGRWRLLLIDAAELDCGA